MYGMRVLLSALVSYCAYAASDLEEFKVKREAVFEFAQAPALQRHGDRVTIAFSVQGFCDATVAVENESGRIVRHLASGVLGANAPAPFQKNAREQVLVWDGKDDLGRYIDDFESHRVRVSLGFKPRFEKNLFWSPHKRLTSGKAILGDTLHFAAAPEGVYVFDGTGVDSVRLFSHAGDYVRTVYPFPAPLIARVQGLERAAFPQDGQSLPIKHGMVRSTLLTSGSSASGNKYGYGAQSMAVQGTRLALLFRSLNRLDTDGSSGGLPLGGPEVAHTVKIGPADMWKKGEPATAAPLSAAFSPDGAWLYLSGFGWTGALGRAHEWLHGVTRMKFAGEARPELFAGSVTQGESGSNPGQFHWATSVACDAAGNVYAADHLNDRIQVFGPDGKCLKAIPATRPVQVCVDPASGEIHVFSWHLGDGFNPATPEVKPAYSRFGALSDPKRLSQCALPQLSGYGNRLEGGGLAFRACVDFWAEPATIWLMPGKGRHPLLLAEEKGKLTVKRDFQKEAQAAVARSEPAILQRQRLYADPASGTLYVGEGDSGVMKSFKELVRIDPESGRCGRVELPFTAEDLCIDLEGHAFLRSDTMVVRYELSSWREVPFDYGEEWKQVGFDGSVKTADAIGALRLPATGRPGWFHLGGMAVAPNGHLAVSCRNSPRQRTPPGGGTAPGTVEQDEKRKFQMDSSAGRPYQPRLYPGRQPGWEIHVWDRRGKLVYEDAFPGLGKTDGIGLDKDDNLYTLAAPCRVLDGKPYFIKSSSTLVKVRAGRAKLLTAGHQVPIAFEGSARPGRTPDLQGDGAHWVENAEWFYGGVGFNNAACICWNARPALDLFARSFAPEIDHYSVAVLDSAGNLILRVGQYGNVDDAGKVGEDGVPLVHAAYLATHTDRRLFIADAGNQRIASVRLGYQKDAIMPLKGVPDLERFKR